MSLQEDYEYACVIMGWMCEQVTFESRFIENNKGEDTFLKDDYYISDATESNQGWLQT